ncbi:TlpA family protein disulfide reductase [Alteromonas sp. HB246098]
MKKGLLLLLLIFSNSSWSQTYEEKIAASKAFIGKPVQEHTFYTLDKQPITFQNLKGEAVVAYFFASWCSPCYEALENLNKAIETTPPTVHVVAISLDGDWASLERMLARTGYTGEVWKSADAELAFQERLFANFTSSLPHIIRIDAQGILIEGGSRVKSFAQWTALINQNASISKASGI